MTEIPLLRALQDESYWQEAAPLMLEHLLPDLHSLVRYLGYDKKRVVYTHFEDSFEGDVKEPPFTEVYTGGLSVFDDTMASTVVNLLEGVKRNAEAA